MANNWFPHDSSAWTDEKIVVLRKRHGIAAIGMYWTLVEECYKNGGALELYKLPIICEAWEMDTADGQKIFKTMCDVRLFMVTGEIFTSRRIQEEIGKMKNFTEIRRTAGKKGGLAKASKARDGLANPSRAKQNVAPYLTLPNTTLPNLDVSLRSHSKLIEKKPKTKKVYRPETTSFSEWLSTRCDELGIENKTTLAGLDICVSRYVGKIHFRPEMDGYFTWMVDNRKRVLRSSAVSNCFKRQTTYQKKQQNKQLEHRQAMDNPYLKKTLQKVENVPRVEKENFSIHPDIKAHLNSL